MAGLLSTSSSSPTLPSGYTKKRLVGAMRNDRSSNFISFYQFNNYVQLPISTTVLISSDNATSYTSLNAYVYIPYRIADFCKLYLNLSSVNSATAGSRCYIVLDSNGSFQKDIKVGDANSPGYYAINVFFDEILLNTNGRFYYKVDDVYDRVTLAISGYNLNS